MLKIQIWLCLCIPCVATNSDTTQEREFVRQLKNPDNAIVINESMFVFKIFGKIKSQVKIVPGKCNIWQIMKTNYEETRDKLTTT